MPCGVQDPDSEDDTYYSVVTTTSQGLREVVTYSRNESGYCEGVLTECSGTTTRTDRIDLTYDPNQTGDCTGGSGFEEIITIDTYAFNEETKQCDSSRTQTGTSELHATWDPGSYDCARTYDGVTWTGPTGNSCVLDWEYQDPYTSYYPCFSSASSETITYDPDPGPDPVIEYSGPLEPTCSFPEYGPWPDEDEDPELPALEPGQSRGSATGFSTASHQQDAFGNSIKQQTQFRITHHPTGTCFLKVWFRKTTTVEGDPGAEPPVPEEVTHDDSTTYEWTGTGNPCFTDPNKAVDDAANLIHGDPIEMPAPELGPDGRAATVVVSVLKFSYLPDYEPDVSDPENPQPSGWPDPFWEPAAP